jgi:hypothetical protein
MFNLATNPPPGPLIWRWVRETSSWSATVGPLRVVVARKLPAAEDQLLMTTHGPGGLRSLEAGPVNVIYAALADPDVGESLLHDAFTRAQYAADLCRAELAQLRGQAPDPEQLPAVEPA